MIGAPLSRFARRFWGDERGISSIIISIFAVTFVELMGLTVDFGHVFWVQQSLQASADASALAGGYNIPNSTAVSTATSYGGAAGKYNANSDFTTTMVSGYPK